jgi:hypothetical protein
MTGPATTSDVPWDLTFLRVGGVATAAVTAVAVPVVGLTVGWPAALGVLLAAVIVSSFFVLSGLVVAWAGRISDSLTMPAALVSLGVKALLLFPLLSALPEDGWLDRRAVAWSVVVGTVLWTLVHVRWVWTRQLYYVRPPAPVGRGAHDPGENPQPAG